MSSEIKYNWNKKNLGKWIKALRSRRYKQSAGNLYNLDSGGYCCLGVVSKISRVCKWDNVDRVFKDNSGNHFKAISNGSMTLAVSKWLGTDIEIYSGCNPEICLPEEYSYHSLMDKGVKDETTLAKALPNSISCSNMNDGWDLTFPQIADMLEYFIYNNLPDEANASAE